jgi:ABC-type bacteriocin/lantibiotic exporter with double-glycine peptidase domain
MQKNYVNFNFLIDNLSNRILTFRYFVNQSTKMIIMMIGKWLYATQVYTKGRVLCH